MEINDLFTIRLNSAQHALLCEVFSELAGLDLPPAHDDAFDSLWESVIEAEHELKFEDWTALDLKNPADCGQLFNWTRDIIAQSFHDIIIWDLEQFWEFQEFVRVQEKLYHFDTFIRTQQSCMVVCDGCAIVHCLVVIVGVVVF